LFCDDDHSPGQRDRPTFAVKHSCMTAQIVLGFLENVWNKGSVEEAGVYLHPDFIDHSLPGGLPPNAEGLKQWVSLTSASFEHQTIIEDMVTEGSKCVVKVTMRMKHIGTWREIPATGREVHTAGYRLFWVKEGMIIAHWAMIDGGALERKLKDIP